MINLGNAFRNPGNKGVPITCHGIYVWAPGVQVSKADQTVANACGDLVTTSDQYVTWAQNQKGLLTSVGCSSNVKYQQAN